MHLQNTFYHYYLPTIYIDQKQIRNNNDYKILTRLFLYSNDLTEKKLDKIQETLLLFFCGI